MCRKSVPLYRCLSNSITHLRVSLCHTATEQPCPDAQQITNLRLLQLGLCCSPTILRYTGHEIEQELSTIRELHPRTQ